MIAAGLFCLLAVACGGGGSAEPDAASAAQTVSTAAGAGRVSATPVATPTTTATLVAVADTAAAAASTPPAAAQNTLGDAVGANPVVASTASGSTPVAGSSAASAAAVDTTTTKSLPLATPTYLRTVVVDAAHASASDSGPGTAAQPYKTIGAAMSRLRPGDDVVVAAGIYREAVVVPALSWNGLRTRLRAQTPRTVLVKGSDEVAGWTAGAAAGTYWAPWLGEEPQQVYRQGVALKQIGGNVFGGYPGVPGNNMAAVHSGDGGIWPGRTPGGIDQLVPDSFTYDAASKRVYVKLAQALTPGQVLEVSARRHTFQAEAAAGFALEGLDFAHSNTTVIYRWGAVKMVGSNNMLNDLVVRDMDGICVQMAGADSTLSNSTIERCGQMGINGFGNRMTIANNVVRYANTRGFNKWWEAGGMKLIGDGGLHNSTIRGNVVTNNLGDGIWIDWMNTQNVLDGNTTAYNAGFGIQYEASQSASIVRNVSYGNTMRGIYLSESATSTIESNVVFANAMEGIAVVDGPRSAAYPELKPRNNRIAYNFMAWNDFNRNWVQLTIPGLGLGTLSLGNVFKTDVLLPRMSVGFMGVNNPAFVDLVAWQAGVGLDAGSSEQKVAMPVALQAAISARTLLTAADLVLYQLVAPR
jgi:hypothetical protein